MSTPVVSSSTPSVELTTLPTALTATQITNAVTQIEVAVKGKTLAEVLAALPAAVESTYSVVQSALGSDQVSIANAVLAIVTQALSLSGLPSADVAVIDEVLTSLVPAIIALVAKYAPEVEEDVENCCTGCWSGFKKLF